LALAFAMLLCAVPVSGGTTGGGTARLALPGSQGAVDVEIELAYTEAERARGLQGRKSLAPTRGMLFDFGYEQPVTMWMQQTYISLDMLFIDKDGVIVGIHHRAEPQSLDYIHAPQPVRAVLEINGGSAQRWGVQVGAQIEGFDALLR
jgi:uncharacterized membrane protein (UPF0127 family)